MRRIFLLFIVAILSFTEGMAQNKALVNQSVPCQTMPIVSDEVITTPPSGQTVADQVRKGYAFYYANGDVNRFYNRSFIGEYVVADDGNIYLKNPCASLNSGSYVKLDKIDAENYVCHTAQLIYVDNSGSTPYPYFVTRLVFVKKGSNSFSFELENDSTDKPVTDIFFTYKDGVLKQKDQELIDLNGELIPHEMLGITNSAGSWIGFGDGCIEYTPAPGKPVSLPAGAEVKEGSFAYNVLASVGGINAQNAMLQDYAIVGDTLFIANPVSEDASLWVKGIINRSDNTVTFLPQYLGPNKELGVHQWFISATYSDYHDIWDEETGYGTWVRNMKVADKYVARFDNGAISDSTAHQTFCISRDPDSLYLNGSYSNIILQPYVAHGAAPKTPQINSFEPYNGLWAQLYFSIAPVDENNVYLNTDSIYYHVFINSETPYVFKASENENLKEDLTDVPYSYSDDWDFVAKDNWHTVFGYEDCQYFGVQAFFKHDGKIYASPIAWYNHAPSTGITPEVVEQTAGKTKKLLKDGRIVIVKNGKSYTVAGQRLNTTERYER